MPTLAKPFTYYLAGFVWSERTGRLGYAIATLVMWAMAALFFVRQDIAGGLSYGAESLLILAIAIWFVPSVGHLMRRLNDAGLSGWLWLLTVIPYLGAAFSVYLMFRRPTPRGRFIDTGPWRSLGFVAACCLAIVLLSRLFLVPYSIPAGSMKPTLLVGDYVIAVRGSGAPERGQVVTFRHPTTGTVFVKRVIGLPGDRIQMVDGVVVINGQAAVLTPAGFFEEVMAPQGPMGGLPRCSNGAVGQGAICQKRIQTEVLPDGTTQTILDIGPSPMDHTAEFTVPAGSVFVLGDNRDNSIDSRFAQSVGGMGFVPVENLRDRPVLVLYSVTGTSSWQLWTLRADRFLKAIR